MSKVPAPKEKAPPIASEPVSLIVALASDSVSESATSAESTVTA
jgi:hypothetical protein